MYGVQIGSHYTDRSDLNTVGHLTEEQLSLYKWIREEVGYKISPYEVMMCFKEFSDLKQAHETSNPSQTTFPFLRGILYNCVGLIRLGKSYQLEYSRSYAKTFEGLPKATFEYEAMLSVRELVDKKAKPQAVITSKQLSEAPLFVIQTDEDGDLYS